MEYKENLLKSNKDVKKVKKIKLFLPGIYNIK